MKRAILALVAIWCVLVGVGSMHTYGDISTQNAGVYWETPNQAHWCGFEYRGHPGFFCDVT